MNSRFVNSMVSVVITTRNRRTIVMDCIASVLRTRYSPLEIIVVDNASTDDTAAALTTAYPQIHVVTSHENLGLAGGRNLGQQLACGEHVLFLDDDTILHDKCISELVRCARAFPRAAIIAPKIYYHTQPNRIWYAGARFEMLTARAHNLGAGELDHGQYDMIREISHAPTAFLARMDVMRLVHGHDPQFVMSFADADLAFRVRREGYLTIFCPTAVLWHRVPYNSGPGSLRGSLRDFGFDTPLRPYFYARNRIIFMKRHISMPHFIIYMLTIYPIFTIYYTFIILLRRAPLRYLYSHLLGTFRGIQYAIIGNLRPELVTRDIAKFSH